MEDFTWVDGERLIRFGRGAVAGTEALLSRRGFDGYVLLTTARAEGHAPGLARAAAEVLHVPHGQVPDAAAAVRDSVRGRQLVALGGGRVIDSAKAIAGADGLRCAAIPTTLSGAEITRIHRMPAGVATFTLVRPEVVVADPALMASQPVPELAASAMNALGHAAEALYTPMRNPVGDIAALRAASAISRGLSSDEPDRDALALGALLGAYALGAAGYAVHHVVCQTLVRVAGTPHAETNAVMLPHTLRLMEPRAPRALAALSDALGDRAPDRVAKLAARAGPTRLGELGVGPGALDEVVQAILARRELGNTPSPPDRAELRELLDQAM